MLTFSCSDPKMWAGALASYDQTLSSLNNPKLTTLDNWYRRELPSLIAGRHPPSITQPELKKLMEWKLSRGKWRPGLLKFVSALNDENVKTASQKAFTALPNLKEAISQLSTLKGVGPATASAVLAVHAPTVAPFMSDEAMVAALGGIKDYSLKQYLLFAEKLQSKATELKDAEKSDSEEFRDWSASDVERALWAGSVKPNASRKSKTDPGTRDSAMELKKRPRDASSEAKPGHVTAKTRKKGK